MIGRWLIAVIFLLAAAAPARAQSAAFSPALYVVRDADSTLYLFGTYHVRPAGAPWGGRNAQNALKRSEEVWLEMVDAPSDQFMVLTYAFDTRGLSTRLTAEQYARLQALLRRYHMPAAAFERMRPWFAGIVLQMLPLVQQGYEGESGADAQIERYALETGKRLRTFETAEMQVQFLSGMSEELQVRLLVATIDAMESGFSDGVDVEEAWERGDLDLIAQTELSQMRADYPEYYDILLVRRNNAWMETLVAELADAGTDFVAVGAAHLAGEHGLVAQLRARGYAVERVAAD